MKYKAFDVAIELEVHAVTCPGVWLCPNGKLTVQIYLLGLCTQTSSMTPVFPLLCHEKFTFRKNFTNIQNLNELDHKLSKEIVYMELIQWENCECGNVLATFKTSLMELLYPFPNRKGILPGIDVDLLMEATRKFPGIIAPKIEISTKISIEEVLCSLRNDKKNDVIVVNPKVISSKCVPKRDVPMRQKKVCHTYRYHKAKTSKMPDNNRITSCEQSSYNFNRSPKKTPRQPFYCGCQNQESLNSNYVHEKIQKLRNCNYADSLCNCKGTDMFCPLCTKYKCYFAKPCVCCIAKDNAPKCKCSKLSDIKEVSEENDIYEKSFLQNEKNGKKYSVEKSSSPKSFSINSNSQAGKIHERLQKSLSSPTNISLTTNDDLYDENTAADRFNKNLEQFYKQLYMRAHYKFKNERCNFKNGRCKCTLEK